jgi:hypothetical protein
MIEMQQPYPKQMDGLIHGSLTIPLGSGTITIHLRDLTLLQLSKLLRVLELQSPSPEVQPSSPWAAQSFASQEASYTTGSIPTCFHPIGEGCSTQKICIYHGYCRWKDGSPEPLFVASSALTNIKGRE